MQRTLKVEQEATQQVPIVLGQEQPCLSHRQQPTPGGQVAKLGAHGDAQIVGALLEQRPELLHALAGRVVAHRDAGFSAARLRYRDDLETVASTDSSVAPFGKSRRMTWTEGCTSSVTLTPSLSMAAS